VLFLVYGSAVVGGLGLSAAAFIGSLTALGLVYLLAQRAGRITPGRLLLSGVAMAYLFQSLFSYVLQQARRPDRLPSRRCSGCSAAWRRPAGATSSCRPACCRSGSQPC